MLNSCFVHSFHLLSSIQQNHRLRLVDTLSGSGGRNESVGYQKSNKTLRGEMKKAMIMATMNDDE